MTDGQHGDFLSVSCYFASMLEKCSWDLNLFNKFKIKIIDNNRIGRISFSFTPPFNYAEKFYQPAKLHTEITIFRKLKFNLNIYLQEKLSKMIISRLDPKLLSNA